jgi:rubrerythrin
MARPPSFMLIEGAHPVARALQAERDARAFFAQAARGARDSATRAIADEMAGEETEHVARLESLV